MTKLFHIPSKRPLITTHITLAPKPQRYIHSWRVQACLDFLVRSKYVYVCVSNTQIYVGFPKIFNEHVGHFKSIHEPTELQRLRWSIFFWNKTNYQINNVTHKMRFSISSSNVNSMRVNNLYVMEEKFEDAQLCGSWSVRGLLIFPAST